MGLSRSLPPPHLSLPQLHSRRHLVPGLSCRLFDSLKRDLEAELMAEAQRSMWDVLTQGSTSESIEAAVHQALCEAQQQQYMKEIPPHGDGGGKT